MPRKKRAPSKPSQAYLVSFGDTMTALLAFFIVLNSLAQEQTGANLYTGTGSFSSAIRGLGVPGWFKTKASKSPIPNPHSKPTYYVDDEGNAIEKGAGPDEDDNGLNVIDRQLEQAQRIVNELEYLFPLSRSEGSQTDVAFDIFEPIDKREGLLNADLRKVLIKCLPLIRKPDYEIELVVWSPTPSQSAWARTAILADEIRKQITSEFNLDSAQSNSIRCVSRTWIHSVEQRPVVSVRVIKRSNQ